MREKPRTDLPPSDLSDRLCSGVGNQPLLCTAAMNQSMCNQPTQQSVCTFKESLLTRNSSCLSSKFVTLRGHVILPSSLDVAVAQFGLFAQMRCLRTTPAMPAMLAILETTTKYSLSKLFWFQDQFDLSQEDKEKRAKRRERNKQAAARCRKRRMDLMESLQKVGRSVLPNQIHFSKLMTFVQRTPKSNC